MSALSFIQLEFDGVTWNPQKILNFAWSQPAWLALFLSHLRILSFFKLYSSLHLGSPLFKPIITTVQVGP